MSSEQNQYFVILLSLKPKIIVGPISITEIKKSVETGAFRLSDICWNSQTKNEWQRLFQYKEILQDMAPIPEAAKLKSYEEKCLKSLVEEDLPTQITKKITKQTELKKTAPLDAASHFPPPVPPFYLQSFGKEYGKLSTEEIGKVLKTGDFKSFIYVWYKGLETWVPIHEIPSLRMLLPETSSVLQLRSQQSFSIFSRETRVQDRVKLVATCRVKNNEKFEQFGVCANISPTGAQIWLEKSLGQSVGESILIEIVPLSVMNLPKFTVQCRIVWYLEAESRVGISFSEFFGSGKIALQSFIEAAQRDKQQAWNK